MASGGRKKGEKKAEGADEEAAETKVAAGLGLDRLTEKQERFIIYGMVIVVVLIILIAQPSFFLGLIMGILGYRFYLDNYSKSGEGKEGKQEKL